MTILDWGGVPRCSLTLPIFAVHRMIAAKMIARCEAEFLTATFWSMSAAVFWGALKSVVLKMTRMAADVTNFPA